MLQRLVAHYAPPSVIVSKNGDIVFIHGQAGRFLQPAPGPPSHNIFNMAHEGLQMVNMELQTKVESLAQANDDMQNLLNSTDIATLFLNNQLHIKRFTPQAKQVIKLIDSDVCRPIGDLVSNLRYENLEADAREVLHTLVAKEREVVAENGEWYLSAFCHIGRVKM